MKGESAFVMGENHRMNVYAGQAERSYGELRMRENATILHPNRFRIASGAFTTGVVELAGNAVVSTPVIAAPHRPAASAVPNISFPFCISATNLSSLRFTRQMPDSI